MFLKMVFVALLSAVAKANAMLSNLTGYVDYRLDGIGEEMQMGGVAEETGRFERTNEHCICNRDCHSNDCGKWDCCDAGSGGCPIF